MDIKKSLDAQTDRVISGLKWVPFGISFLDDVFLGIGPNDLFLLGAATGVGKTEIALQIAANAGSIGKRVHFFALESYKGEMQDRLIYRQLAQKWWDENPFGKPGVIIRFRSWLKGDLEDELSKYEREVRDSIAIRMDTVSEIGRGKEFDIDKFVEIFDVIKDDTDLVIIDHVHYFDSNEENEVRALKNLVKKIRDVTLDSGVPIFLLGHLRKKQNTTKNLLPDIDDFFGSSDLTKIATEIILIARAENIDVETGKYPTWIYMPKGRTTPDSYSYAGLLTFDVKAGGFSNSYVLHKLKRFSEPEEITDENLLPRWAKRAKKPPKPVKNEWVKV